MEAIKDIVIKHLQAVRKGIEENMNKMHRTASGRSVASLMIEEESSTDAIHVILTGDKQWEVMQCGRGAGKVPYNFSEIIKEWITRKGISFSNVPGKTPERKLNNLSWMISQSIMKKGTKLHRDHGYNDIFDTLLNEETEKMATEVQDIIEIEYETINNKDNEEKSN